MYPPHRVPRGPHYVYIFYDNTRSRFKIGETRRLTERRTEAAREVLSWHLRPTLQIYHRWEFQNYYAGIHVEQTAINLLKMHGFLPVREPDWFEIDKTTMDEAIAVIDDLAKSIIRWEDRNGSTECYAVQVDRPYGEHILGTDYVTMGDIFENSDGSIEYLEPDLARRIARAKNFYQRTGRRMPDGLARLVAEAETNSPRRSD